MWREVCLSTFLFMGVFRMWLRMLPMITIIRQCLLFIHGEIYMKRIFVRLVCLCATMCLLSSCAERGVSPSEVLLPEETTIKNVKVELPANYSQKNYKRLFIGVYFEIDERNQDVHNVTYATLPSVLESEMSKIKRFSIVTRHSGQKNLDKEKNFQNSGKTDKASRVDVNHGWNANYVMSCDAKFFCEEYERYDHNEFIYVARLSYQLVDMETHEIIDADVVEGRASRTCVRLPSGKIVAGFDPRRDDQIEPITQAATNGARLLGLRLGLRLPIGAKIAAMRGSRFQINKGVAEGFVGEQFVTIYMNDCGIDIPLAAAKINPAEHSATGEVCKWSTHPDDQVLIQRLQSDPNFVHQHDVYVVSQGMPAPPEWENNYAQ